MQYRPLTITDNTFEEYPEVDIYSTEEAGYQAHADLRAFAREIKAVMRDVIFLYRDSKAMHVYRKGDPMTLGKIGLGKNNDYDDIYMVTASSIENHSHAQWSSGYNTKISTKRKVALKNALTYLQPITAQDIMDRSLSAFTHKQSYTHHAEKSKTVDAREGLLADEDMWRELLSMGRNGFKFVDPDVQEKFATWINTVDEYEEYVAEYGGKDNDVIMVYTTSYKGEVRYKYAWAAALSVAQEVNARQLEEYVGEEGMRAIKGKVAALDMPEEGNFIAGVGMKASAGVYYVIR